MAKPLPDRIADLKSRQKQLADQLNSLEAKARTEERKRDTHRKIVVGGAVLEEIGHDEALARKVRELLAKRTLQPKDREALADLLPGGSEGTAKTK